jgi:hypothetical protein
MGWSRRGLFGDGEGALLEGEGFGGAAEVVERPGEVLQSNGDVGWSGPPADPLAALPGGTAAAFCAHAVRSILPKMVASPVSFTWLS